VTENERFDYLDEHLPYALKMVRYDFNKINTELHYLDWNAYFESFAVNARNLVNLLTNRDKGNVQAQEFVRGFRARKGDIQGPMNNLEKQVFHLAKRRPREDALKFGREKARPVFEWIEEGMGQFVSELSSADKPKWNAQKADPCYGIDTPATGGPTGMASPQSASSTIASIARRNATTSGSAVKIVDSPKRQNLSRQARDP
jgi:hypothetical protein